MHPMLCPHAGLCSMLGRKRRREMTTSTPHLPLTQMRRLRPWRAAHATARGSTLGLASSSRHALRCDGSLRTRGSSCDALAWLTRSAGDVATTQRVLMRPRQRVLSRYISFMGTEIYLCETSQRSPRLIIRTAILSAAQFQWRRG